MPAASACLNRCNLVRTARQPAAADCETSVPALLSVAWSPASAPAPVRFVAANLVYLCRWRRRHSEKSFQCFSIISDFHAQSLLASLSAILELHLSLQMLLSGTPAECRVSIPDRKKVGKPFQSGKGCEECWWRCLTRHACLAPGREPRRRNRAIAPPEPESASSPSTLRRSVIGFSSSFIICASNSCAACNETRLRIRARRD